MKGRTHVSEYDHCAYIALVERLRAEAEQRGDAAFAAALAECTVHVSGGDLDCPMGQLILEDTLRSGKLPGASFPSPSALPPSRQSAPPVPSRSLKRGEIFEKLQHLLKQEATRRGDTRYLEALEACMRSIKKDKDLPMIDCPVHRILQARKDGQGPDGEV